MKTLEWKPATVGCHWFADRVTRYGRQSFAVSTRVTVRGGNPVLTYPDSGYALYCNCQDLGMFKSLKAAQGAAERTPKRKLTARI